MEIYRLVSDQLINWSDTYERKEILFTALEKAQYPARPSIHLGLPSPAWVTHRALQAVRETRVQVCKRPRARPQVLSFGQSFQNPPRDGLRPTGTSSQGREVSPQFPASQGSHRRNLQYQSGTSPQARGVLNHPHDAPLFHISRHEHRRYFSGQHDSGLAPGRAFRTQSKGRQS